MTGTGTGYPASAMGPRLRAEVEGQLRADLEHHGVAAAGLTFDWSNPCQEGHVTEHLDGRLESMSDVGVCDAAGAPVASGWIDFVHGTADAPLFVFWLLLRVRDGGRWRDVRTQPVIPAHVWEWLPDRSKDLCAVEGRYDARWSRDPLVVAWRRLP